MIMCKSEFYSEVATADEIEKLYSEMSDLSGNNADKARERAGSVIAALDRGELRACVEQAGVWVAVPWVKKAILSWFYLSRSVLRDGDSPGFDKLGLKFDGWSSSDFESARIRAVPGSVARYGAYIGKDVVLMPSFVNIGAYVGEGSMVDTWATVGSCAQVGKRCHISGGAGIGGVLEPIGSAPVVIEDDVFIGARSEIAEGVVVRRGAVIGMGVYIGMSTPIVSRETGEVVYGEVPAGAVIVSGSRQSIREGISTYAAVIVKQVDEKTQSRTTLNSIVRDTVT